MLIYFAMLMVPLALGWAHPRMPRKRYTGLWIYFAVALVFCGLRNEVGADWMGYSAIYDRYEDTGFGDLLHTSEQGFYFLNIASRELGTGFGGVIFVCAWMFLYGCFRYARQTSNPWLAVAVVMPYLVFIISLSGIRQAAAIGVGLYLFATWRETGLIKKLALISLAVLFHSSSAIYLIFIVFGIHGKVVLRVVLAGAILAFVSTGLNETEVFDKYRNVYIVQNVASDGAFFHVLLTAFPASLYLLFRKKLAAAGFYDPNVMLASFLSLLALPLLSLSSTGIDRLVLHFSFVQMWVYPALLSAGVANRAMLKAGIASIVLAIFFVYFLYGSHSGAYIPYRNVLLS
ncbi:MAG: EpsG family protein [Pseudomonadota bacterium]